MLLQSLSQIVPMPKRHTTHEKIIENLENCSKFLICTDLEKVGMADGNETGNTMMIEHETRTKLNSPSASSTPPSPSSPKSTLAEEKAKNKNSDHNGNAANGDRVVTDKSQSLETAPNTTIPSMPSNTAASFPFQSLMGALGSLPPAMATAAFQALANISPGAESALPPAILAALPPEMVNLMQQLNSNSTSFSAHQQLDPQHLSSPSSLNSDTVSSYVGEHHVTDRNDCKTNNNNDVPVTQNRPLSRQQHVGECEEQNENEAPDTPPSSLPGKTTLRLILSC